MWACARTWPACGPLANALRQGNPVAGTMLEDIKAQVAQAQDHVDDVLIPAEDFSVMSPSNHGPAGSGALNL